MAARLPVILLTFAGFSAGLGAGLWIGTSRIPTPPPPSWLHSEFTDITTPGASLQQFVQARPELWREMNTELAELKPRIDEFRAHLQEIDADFRRDFEAILRDEQRKTLAEAQQRRTLPRIHTDWKPPAPAPATSLAQSKSEAPKTSARPAPAAPAQAAPTPPKVFHERTDGLVSSLVFNPYTKARFAATLGLDDDQEEKLGLLLENRRRRFLELCDATPPPSLQLNRIADIIRQAQKAK